MSTNTRSKSRASAMSPIAAAAASSSSSSSCKFLLSQDVLHCLLNYFEFLELDSITQINKQWREAVRTLKPRKQFHLTCYDQQWEDFVSPSGAEWRFSALLPHVSEISVDTDKPDTLRYHCERLHLFPSIESVNRLQIQNCKQKEEQLLSQSDDLPARFPISLTSLNVIAVGTAAMQSVISAAGLLPNLETFSLCYPDTPQPFSNVDFTPLLTLSQLHSLTVMQDYDVSASEEEEGKDMDLEDDDTNVGDLPSQSGPDRTALFDVVRQMLSLRRIYFDQISAKVLNDLAKEPTDLTKNLQWIEMGPESDQLAYNALSQFTGLTEITMSGTFRDPQFLCRFSNLTKLDLNFEDSDSGYPPSDQLVTCIKTIGKLQSLSLCNQILADRHLVALFQHLPNLTSLELNCCLKVKRLLWIRTHATRLKSLQLLNCPTIAAKDVKELLVFTHLEALIIDSSFDGPLSEDILVEFRPPSQKLPCLSDFSYDHEDEEGENEEEDDDGNDDEDSMVE